MAIRPPQTLFLYHTDNPRKRWCVAGDLVAPELEREEFRSYGAADDWAKLYLKERNGGEIHCYDREGYHAISVTVARAIEPEDEATRPIVKPPARERPSALAERSA